MLPQRQDSAQMIGKVTTHVPTTHASMMTIPLDNRYDASLGGPKTCKHNILRVFEGDYWIISFDKYLRRLLVNDT